jgi:hypothetical protein
MPQAWCVHSRIAFPRAAVPVKTLWQDPVGRHVVIAVAVKLCLLMALWLAFVKDANPPPRAADAGAAILRLAPPTAEPAKEGAR